MSREEQIEAAWLSLRGERFTQVQHYRRLRERVGSEQAWRCCYCGTRTTEADPVLHGPTLEHVVPRSRGGCDSYENAVLACAWCNSTRGSMRAGEFYAVIRRVLSEGRA